MYPGLALAGLLPALSGGGVQPHVGGVPTLAYFDAPRSVGNLADQSFTLAWSDNDMDPTGSFNFFYSPTDLPLNAGIDQLAGTAIPGGADFLISRLDDTLVWDTSLVPAGSYFVYEVTVDPGLLNVFNLSRGVVTVQHPGDPRHPAVFVTSPGPLSGPVANLFAVRWEASGEGPLTATVRGRKAGEPDFVELAAALPLAADGELARGCFLWNLSTRPSGYYEVQVEVKDQGGRTHTAHAITPLTIYRDPNPRDAAVPASCESATVDAGSGGDGDDGDAATDAGGGDGPCACRVGGAAGMAMVPLGSLALALAFSLLRRRSRR